MANQFNVLLTARMDLAYFQIRSIIDYRYKSAICALGFEVGKNKQAKRMYMSNL